MADFVNSAKNLRLPLLVGAAIASSWTCHNPHAEARLPAPPAAARKENVSSLHIEDCLREIAAHHDEYMNARKLAFSPSAQRDIAVIKSYEAGSIADGPTALALNNPRSREAVDLLEKIHAGSRDQNVRIEAALSIRSAPSRYKKER